MNIEIQELKDKYVAQLENAKDYDKEVLVLIPAYKREEMTFNILEFYCKLGYDSVSFLQAFSNDTLLKIYKLEEIYNVKVHLGESQQPTPIGTVRKELFRVAGELETTYRFWLMQDNDLLLTEDDIKLLLFYGYNEKFIEYKVISPDTRMVIKDDSDYMESRLCFNVLLLRSEEIRKVYHNLSEIEANEDSEIIYLLENKGLVINLKYFESKLDDPTVDTVIDDKLRKLSESAQILKEKYGDDCEVEVRPSGKTITKFKYERKFPMKLRFNEKPITKYYNSENNMKITMTSWPRDDFRRRCYDMIKSTWADQPIEHVPTEEEVNNIFNDLLTFKVLPNSMEHLQFTFLVEGLNLVEISHLLRHRVLASIHAQCSGDRDLRHDSVFIPSSIDNSKFALRYKKLTEDTKQLYSDMFDSKDVSILDARYILPRNHRYFYYVTVNLKDAMGIIRQRMCEQIQPENDNIFSHMIYHLISQIVPELKQHLKLKCGPRCFYIITSKMDNSRVYQPNKNHLEHIKDFNKNDYLYSKTRKEMGVKFNSQEE